MRKILAGLLAASFMATSAVAANSVAVITGASGKVLVNKGEGFVPVVGSFELSAGDRVMIGDDSFATLSYAECSVALSKPTVLSVSADAPCATEAQGVFVTPTADLTEPVAAGLPWGVIAVGVVVGVPATYFIAKEVLDNEDCVSC